MSSRSSMWVAAAGAALLLAPCMLLGIGIAGVAATGASCMVSLPTGASSSTTATASTAWDNEQVGNASTIVAVGSRLRIPRYGWVIAVATAMQESSLRNLGDLGAHNDHDSLGLFQQRPSQGWGTPAQIMQPEYAATQFYQHLLRVDGWQTMTLTRAAQAVQRSAYPDAYAKWQPDAERLVTTVTGSSGAGFGCAAAGGTADAVFRNPDGSYPPEPCSIRPDPTTGRGCLTPRTLHLVQQTRAAGFPAPSCWDQRSEGEHPLGRACDFMMTSGGEATGAEKARGDAMAAWAVANADRLGLKYVIWFRRIWTRRTGSWQPYQTIAGNDPSGWHTNHVHISVE
ncbi:hypothetical protein ACWT_5798 [Actinoplanes sp. SE50]|nr:hypothetical protein ACPL_5929 [Actinoplanes sp. SE50/110]ATO85213.1 hypothetical protein ACWT_5798 [Actinoplanes sp. SE50]SLM02623.1 hypothetical protein ACSP50_5905 [Actinoplanes sp. SE50/110]